MSSNKILKRLVIAIIFVAGLSACNDDFNEIGSSIVDNANFDAKLYNRSALTAHSLKIERIQSNGLSSYALGVYNDPMYGKTTANVLTQLRLSRENPTFGEGAILDSVVLQLPYYSTIKGQTENGNTYELDSVFGHGTINMSVYRSNYFLRDYDPSENYDPQIYYTDDMDKFEQNLEGTPLYSVQGFKPSKLAVRIIKPEMKEGVEEMDTSYISPRFRVNLSKEYFQEAIMDKENTDALLSTPNFRDYFRGIYFKVEESMNEGVMSLLDFQNDEAGIILYYKTPRVVGEDDEEETTYRYNEFQLEFGRQIVNVFDSDYNQLPAQDDNLYIKGGAGSMAIIDLFTDENQLDSLRQTEWLINEANLKFYINDDLMPSSQESPQRLMVYDVKNNIPLKDYITAGGVKDNDVLDSRTIHLGRIEKDANGFYYKMKITDYIHDIINNDSTNTRLGLVASQNVNIDRIVKSVTSEEEVEKIPASSVVVRNGTVLYGPEAPQDKALKLEIYYTQPR